MASHPGFREGGTFAVAGASNRRIVTIRPKVLGALKVAKVLLLCGRSALLAEILRRFSSSLLPPSFAAGRRTTVFTSLRCAARSAALARSAR
jgi:hypothetical protein